MKYFGQKCTLTRLFYFFVVACALSILLFRHRTETEPAKDEPKIILLWTRFFYSPWPTHYLDSCPALQAKCRLTNQRSPRAAAEADAVMFHYTDLRLNDLPDKLQRRPDQYYVFFSHESAAYSPVDLKLFPPNFFNWTSTTRLDSDVPWPYSFYRREPGWRKDRTGEALTALAKKTNLSAWMVSNCATPSQREVYMKAAARLGLRVDVYGDCGSLACPKTQVDECTRMIATKYKFYFALENSVCKDYNTEKILLFHGRFIVPIVLKRSVAEYSFPKHSFIALDDFDGPETMIAYLEYLDKNNTAYLDYFGWMNDGWRRLSYYPNAHYTMCGLCEKLLDNVTVDQGPRSYRDIHSWWHEGSECVESYAAKLLRIGAQ